MTFGNRIRECRKLKGMTLQQVGDLFQINRASVSDWESGKTRPDIERLVSLARALSTSVDYLLTGKKSAAGSWPFSISWEDYERLPQDQKTHLDRMVSSFVEAAAPAKSNGTTGHR